MPRLWFNKLISLAYTAVRNIYVRAHGVEERARSLAMQAPSGRWLSKLYPINNREIILETCAENETKQG
jgi:hypothetical protein